MLKIFATLGIVQASLALLLFIAKSHQRLSMVGRLRRPFINIIAIMYKKIPQPIIDLLQPQKDFSYVKYLGSQNNKIYYILSYYEPVDVGFPMVALWENGEITMVDIKEVFTLIDLFIKE